MPCRGGVIEERRGRVVAYLDDATVLRGTTRIRIRIFVSKFRNS